MVIRAPVVDGIIVCISDGEDDELMMNCIFSMHNSVLNYGGVLEE